MQDHTHLPATDSDAMPDLDALLNRANLAARDLIDARDGHAGGTAHLVHAYEELAEAHQGVVATLAVREDELTRCESQLAMKDVEAAQLSVRLEASEGEAARLGDEVRRLTDVARDAIGQVRTSHAECDDLRSRLDAVSTEHRRLTLAFQELITQVGQGARGLSDEGRRISGIVAPAPARMRPAPLRSEERAPAPALPAAAPAPVTYVPAPVQAPAQVQAPARIAATPAPAALPGPSGDIEADIRNVLAMTVAPVARPAPTSPQPVSIHPTEVVTQIEEPERREMASALSGFGILRRKTA